MLTRMLQAAIILIAGTTTLASQTAYPTRPITMVVAFNAGGSTDLIARVLAQRMGAILGQNVIIENKGGADGAIGTASVTRAAPDGYTIILSTTSTHVINPLLYKTITYNPSTDFQPIALVAQSPNILVSSPKFDAKSVTDVIARAKAAPGTLNVATGATMHLLNGAMFKSMAGAQLGGSALQGLRPRAQRPDLQSGRPDVRPVAVGAGAGPGRQAESGRGDFPAAHIDRARYSDHCRIRPAGVRGDLVVGRLRAAEDATRDRQQSSTPPSGRR